MKFPRRIAASFLAPLFEERCAACFAPVSVSLSGFFSRKNDTPPPLCAACAKELQRRIGGYCPACGNMAASPGPEPALCGRCLIRQTAGKQASWERMFFFNSYEGLLRDLILRCKAAQDISLALLLGRLLASHPGIPEEYDALVPIPLHDTKLRKRGFNQAVEIARPLARRLNVALSPHFLARTEKTHTQTGLTLEERKRNVDGVFAAPESVRGLRLLVIDDIATTCATLEEAAQTLKNAGALRVDAAILARTPEHLPG